jgi:hypothetical protein
MEIIIKDKTNQQSNTINSVFSGGGESWITIFKPLEFTCLVEDNAQIIIPLLNKSSDDSLADIQLSLFNVTTIAQGKYCSNVAIYDPPQISPLTSYDDLNFMSGQVFNGSIDIPTIGGNAVVRVLPVTEDVLKTLAQKESETKLWLDLASIQNPSSQLEQNGGDFAANAFSVDISTKTIFGEDYTIQSPVFSDNGYATTIMTCSATKFTDKSLPGIILPGSAENTKINVAGYTIFPSIISQATTGKINAQQYLDSFDAYFLPRYFISNIRHDKKIGYTVTNYNDECPGISGYSSFGFSGVYAASGDKITIVYSISDKFNLMKDGELRVKIYSNQVVDLDGTMDMIYNTIMSAQAKGGGDLGPFFSSSPIFGLT